MSAETLAVVRAYCDRLSAGDTAGMRATFAPDVIWYGTRGGLDENRVLRGPDALDEYFREIQAMWERLDVELEQLIDADDTVVAFWSEIVRSHDSDLDMRTEIAVVFKVRRGKIVDARAYLDRAEALEAAELGE